jgi:hypothetical protein
MPSRVPTAVTVLAILGIVFGSLGILCEGGSVLVLGVVEFNRNILPALHQTPQDQRIANIIGGFIHVLLSFGLLIPSAASLNLKPIGRVAMVWWALVDIAWHVVELILRLALFAPHVQNNPVFQRNPNLAPFATAMAIVGPIINWAIATTFAGLTYYFFTRPNVIAAFESPPRPSAPIPPILQ